MRHIFSTAGAVIVWVSLLFSSLNEANAQANPVDPQTAAALQAKLDNLAANNNLKGLSTDCLLFKNNNCFVDSLN